MRRHCIESIMVFLLFVASTTVASAQEEYDYRRYKFYDDEEWWWRPVTDSVTTPTITLHDTYDLAYEARYALSAVQHRRRGEGVMKESYLGKATLGYSAARLLRSLGHYGKSDGVNNHQRLDNERYMQYCGQRLNLRLTGRDEWGSLMYRITHRPKTNGVRLRDGWQFTHYARMRTGKDIYVDGVASNGVDVALDAVRQTKNSTLSIVALVPWSESGRREATTAEAYALAGNTRYNPAWGVQSGKVRSARVHTSLHPEAIVAYTQRLTLATTLSVSADVGFERRGREALTWFNSLSPEPDNYHYLPSSASSEAERRAIIDAWQSEDMRYTQIDWASLYHTNALQRDGHAVYAVERRMSDSWHTALNTSFESRLVGVDLEYGVVIDAESERRYKRMHDLMGATHIVDLDYYLEDDASLCRFMQNDLRNPNRRITEGDRFGYNYRLGRVRGDMFVGAKWSNNQMSWSVEARVGSEVVRRRGLYEKEIFQGAGSYGHSRSVVLNPYRVAAAWSYAKQGHILAADISLSGKSPSPRALFLNPDYNNRTTTLPRVSHHLMASLTYGYTSQSVKARATMFVGSAWGVARMVRYYDDLSHLFANAEISDLGHLNIGVEVDAEVQWSQYFSSNFSLTAGSFRNARDGYVRLYDDADNHIIAEGVTAMRGTRNATPTVTGYGDITFSRGGWKAQLAAQYWGGRYVEPSPIRRMMRYTELKVSQEELRMLTSQQRLKDAVTADISLSKSLKLFDYKLVMRVEVKNIIGTDYVIDASEQHRVRMQEVDGRGYIRPFDNLMLYGYPRTYQLSATLLF